MNKHEFWLTGMKNEWYKDAFWVKSCLSIFRTDDKEHYLVRADSNGYYYLNADTNTKEYIDGAVDTSKPLLDFKEFITEREDFRMQFLRLARDVMDELIAPVPTSGQVTNASITKDLIASFRALED